MRVSVLVLNFMILFNRPLLDLSRLFSIIFSPSKATTIPVGIYYTQFSSVQFSHSVVSDSLWPHESQHARSEDIKKRWQEYTEELYKKDLHDPDNHDGMITHLEPDILECEVKWALESITTNKASGGDGIPVELLQILKDDAVKVLHSICQQIWKTQ